MHNFYAQKEKIRTNFLQCLLKKAYHMLGRIAPAWLQLDHIKHHPNENPEPIIAHENE